MTLAQRKKEKNKINFDQSDSANGPAINRYSGVRMSNASDDARTETGAPGQNNTGNQGPPNRSSYAGSQYMMDMQVDPMTSTLLTSQV